MSALLIVAAVSFGQQGFPLRPGEWESTTSMPGMKEPFKANFCLNDEQWIKALTQNKTCKIDQLSVNSGGASYAMDCSNKAMQIKGKIDLKFDGKEHMTGTGKMSIAYGGNPPADSTTVTEYRWKNADCNAQDMNLRKKR